MLLTIPTAVELLPSQQLRLPARPGRTPPGQGFGPTTQQTAAVRKASMPTYCAAIKTCAEHQWPVLADELVGGLVGSSSGLCFQGRKATFVLTVTRSPSPETNSFNQGVIPCFLGVLTVSGCCSRVQLTGPQVRGAFLVL